MGSPTVYKIYCVGCRKHLFSYRGDFTGVVLPRQFIARPGVPDPAPGEPLICPQCHKPWYMQNSRTGALIVMTDKGWKPRAPEGKQPEGVASSLMMHPEHPPEFKGTNPDFVDPLEKVRRSGRKHKESNSAK